MNGYEEKIKDRLFLEVCNAAGREEWEETIIGIRLLLIPASRILCPM